jgi:hypothetical protein
VSLLNRNRKDVYVAPERHKAEPYATIARRGWVKWYVEVRPGDYYYKHHYHYYYVFGSKARAESLAKRKLRMVKRRIDWSETVTRLDIER